MTNFKDYWLSSAAERQIIRLKKENETLRAKTSVSLGVGDGAGDLFVYGDYDSIKTVQDKIFELEALRAKLAKLAEQEDATPSVKYVDGLGAVRGHPACCREGVSYVVVGDTVYWPLSEEDAQLLRAAGCGRGDFTGPSRRLIIAVSEFLEALQNNRK